MKHWGWIWCRENSFGMWQWNDNLKKRLIRGINEILDQEGYYANDEKPDDDPREAEIEIRLEQGDSFYTTLAQLESEEKTSGVPNAQAGPNAQLRQLDIKSQPGSYGSKLGDAVMTPREFVARLLG